MKTWLIIIISSFATASLTVQAQESRSSITGTCASIGYSSKCCPPTELCQASDGNCMCDANCHLFGDCCQDYNCIQIQAPKGQPSITGTCASIGYSSKCCPPGENCNATDGNCRCSANCHIYRDCCQDHNCPQNPTTCQDIGIRMCCNDIDHKGICDVYTKNGHCSCNLTCHQTKDCCPDVEDIGCIPRTCTEAGLSPGCCIGIPKVSCYVKSEKCFCDSACYIHNDCCTDVPMRCARALLSSSQLLSYTKQQLMIARAQKTRENRHTFLSEAPDDKGNNN